MSIAQVRRNSKADSIAVLRTLSATLGGRLGAKRVKRDDGSILTRALRATYREHKIELLANEEAILADVEARFGHFELLKINERPWKYRYGKPAAAVLANGVEHWIYAYKGSLSAAQTNLVESGVLTKLLESIAPQEREEINVSQRLVRVVLRNATAERVMACIHAVIDLMPHESSDEKAGAYLALPDSLQPLVPLLAKWAIDDDEERSRKLGRCAASTRQKLVDVVIPLLPALDVFLDSFGVNPPEEACALGSLAQAALEAQSILKRATKK
jgi:hypothetical protein